MKRGEPKVGTIVLDSQGLSKASRNRSLKLWLDEARTRNADIVVSAATLAEVLSGHPRDAAVFRVLSRFVVVPVSRKLGTEAGRLRGAAGFVGGAQAIDAIVAATARNQEPPVWIMTSDVGDLSKLLADHPEVKVVLV
ncbi:MAG: type II toxin-antitoxin system VapC family toxin [Mycobacteriales bacterium]